MEYNGDIANLKQLYDQKLAMVQELEKLVNRTNFSMDEEKREMEIEQYLQYMDKRERLFADMQELDKKIYSPLYNRETELIELLKPIREEKENEISVLVALILDKDKIHNEQAKIFMQHIKENLKDINDGKHISETYGDNAQGQGSVFIDRQG